MADTSTPTETSPFLRLVSVNPHPFRPLMAVNALERRRAAAERRLRLGAAGAPERAGLRRQCALIDAILATRLMDPARARRLEQELRWLTRHDGEPAEETGVTARIGHWLRSLLPSHDTPSAAA